jgi:hypothetical protein
MGSRGGHRSLSTGLKIGAVALVALVALFIGAPSTWGNGVVDHGGRVVQNTTKSIAAPRAVSPGTGQQLQASAHTFVLAVLIVSLGVAVIGCTRRLDHRATAFGSSPALLWVNRRGPPRHA